MSHYHGLITLDRPIKVAIQASALALRNMTYWVEAGPEPQTLTATRTNFLSASTDIRVQFTQRDDRSVISVMVSRARVTSGACKTEFEKYESAVRKSLDLEVELPPCAGFPRQHWESILELLQTRGLHDDTLAFVSSKLEEAERAASRVEAHHYMQLSRRALLQKTINDISNNGNGSLASAQVMTDLVALMQEDDVPSEYVKHLLRHGEKMLARGMLAKETGMGGHAVEELLRAMPEAASAGIGNPPVVIKRYVGTRGDLNAQIAVNMPLMLARGYEIESQTSIAGHRNVWKGLVWTPKDEVIVTYRMKHQGGAASATALPAGASLPGSTPHHDDDSYDRLGKLGELRASGVLTEDEFAAEKLKILNGSQASTPIRQRQGKAPHKRRRH